MTLWILVVAKETKAAVINNASDSVLICATFIRFTLL